MGFCTSGQALLKAGLNVHTNFYSGMNLLPGNPKAPVEYLISGATSVINNLARYNFSDNYVTLNEDVKYLLNELASNLAAIYMIIYDMSGYTSRVEAEDIINVLRDAILRDLSILRDKKPQEFMKNA